MKLFYTIIITVVLLLVVSFSVQNTAEIQLKYSVLNWAVSESMPLYLLIFISFFAGIILAGFLGIVERFRLARVAKKLNKKIKKLEKEFGAGESLTAVTEAESSDE
ncbi:MAG: lipopolysaccharide assembly protein LapA domain-containing protein [Syntrophales bacterium]|nr:lipopolysaccharide assembly protein LapA domain-containing protein [Syntrophales bacterium]